MTTWLPPPVPTWRPSTLNFSVAKPASRASSYSAALCATCSDQEATGWTLTSITPGSGVTEKRVRRSSSGGG